jgi:hypothetical protein
MIDRILLRPRGQDMVADPVSVRRTDPRLIGPVRLMNRVLSA